MIYKTDLALQYFPQLSPKQAKEQLLRYCTNKPELKQDLIAAGYDFASKTRYFTPKEVAIIASHLGPP